MTQLRQNMLRLITSATLAASTAALKARGPSFLVQNVQEALAADAAECKEEAIMIPIIRTWEDDPLFERFFPVPVFTEGEDPRWAALRAPISLNGYERVPMFATYLETILKR